MESPRITILHARVERGMTAADRTIKPPAHETTEIPSPRRPVRPRRLQTASFP